MKVLALYRFYGTHTNQLNPILSCIFEQLLLLHAVEHTRQSLLEVLGYIVGMARAWHSFFLLVLQVLACSPWQWLVKLLSKRRALLDQVNRWLACIDIQQVDNGRYSQRAIFGAKIIRC